MSKIRVVQYINQFFAQIGGEEKADIPAELREGPVGPGLALNQAWGDEAEVVATVICGDSYFAEHEAAAKEKILGWVKEIKPDNNTRDMEKLAASIVDTLSGEHYIKAVVGIGTPIGNVKDLAASFKEAQIAMEVGKVFDTERQVISYDHLGIARLIYQLPTTLCEAFLREVFKQDSIDSLDSETLFTIQRFFENNLNVSETSRGLFVHRNTLVYRLEKIKKLTGLDLRKFDDAIVFKVALMVKKYLSANPAKY